MEQLSTCFYAWSFLWYNLQLRSQSAELRRSLRVDRGQGAPVLDQPSPIVATTPYPAASRAAGSCSCVAAARVGTWLRML